MQNQINKLPRAIYHQLDSAKRKHNRLSAAYETAYYAHHNADELQKICALDRQAHTEWLDALETAWNAIGYLGLCYDILLSYKYKKAIPLQAVVHNNIIKSREEKWWENIDKDDFMACAFMPDFKSTPCSKNDAEYEDNRRQYDPFYGYSLSQSVQAETEGTVKISSHIIDIMRTDGTGFIRGVKPSRILP